ncbi:unnamed protein product [Miscanthus lutarioriparius]|uniref:Dof zinc finger protein n=1 Tax=Miscanthus lutarioriparius TaxID=422564 RepID=A0A811R332_9POAL|nr:unnamed protein product [Miscanthus lutarioriparius]
MQEASSAAAEPGRRPAQHQFAGVDLRRPKGYAAAPVEASPAVAKVAEGGEGDPCPRCASRDTKFCYYNNYNTSQPRHFCKGCRRYWTKGGTLRNVPVGGGARKKPSSTSPSPSSYAAAAAADNKPPKKKPASKKRRVVAPTPEPAAAADSAKTTTTTARARSPRRLLRLPRRRRRRTPTPWRTCCCSPGRRRPSRSGSGSPVSPPLPGRRCWRTTRSCGQRRSTWARAGPAPGSPTPTPPASSSTSRDSDAVAAPRRPPALLSQVWVLRPACLTGT